MTQTVFPLSAGTARHAAQPRAARVLAAMMAAMGAALLTGCVVPPVDGGYGGGYGGSYGSGGYYESNTVVYTQYGSPPPPRVEYRTVSPYPDYVWVGGDWVWGGRRYDWRPGRWEPPHYGAHGRDPVRPGWGGAPQRPRPQPERPYVQPPRPGHGSEPPPRPEWGGRPDRPRPEQPAVRPQPPRWQADRDARVEQQWRLEERRQQRERERD